MLASMVAWTGSEAARAGVLAYIIIFFLMSYNVCWDPLAVAYPVEILPFGIRAKGLALLIGSIKGASFFHQFVNRVSLEKLGWKYYIVYCFWLVVVLATVGQFSETKTKVVAAKCLNINVTHVLPRPGGERTQKFRAAASIARVSQLAVVAFAPHTHHVRRLQTFRAPLWRPPLHVDSVVATLDKALAKQGVSTKKLDRWKEEMPTEQEMLAKDKYTVFDRYEKKYRKGLHKLPKWTRVSQRLNPPGF
ncbi:General substrate transporter [Macrophomina phaseolina MS6]|uniref:General substrate transporter n=1 Tax=Macrophomina phaseolina (strain MS6) TaxID=1126212 RepID=K2RR78_MACPH|nr:General substrate transporter [Macrophomina phaseolina MS6]